MTEEDQVSTLMAELQDSGVRQSVMEYIATKSASGSDDKQRLSQMIATIAMESRDNQKSTALWKSRTKKSIAIGLLAVIVAITVQFLVNYFSNEMSKESHVKGGTMVGTDGSVVKTQNDAMSLNADGQMVGRGKSAKTVKTTPSLNKVALASSLPDTTLMALDEITVYSDKGHTLRVNVQGFSRVPVLNSHCGNVVNFYTAWRGRITLDSTDLSFDDDTAKEFKDAGFSLAVGGFGGRRLVGGTRSNAFFKHVDKLKKSGSWTCADVPLPTTVDTMMMRETEYEPCKEHACYSDFGGLQLGVAKIAEAHALAAMPVTKRIRTVLKGKANEVFYRRSETTTIMSPTYSLEIKTVPEHFGQERINLVDRVNDKTATFQLVIGNKAAVAYCKAGVDDSLKRTKKTIADKEVDSDVHFQFNGLVQEEGKVLRHWKWSMAKSMQKAGGGPLASGGGEFWDYADTLLPYRQLAEDGSIAITESFSVKCTDADVEAALALRTNAGVKELLECKVQGFSTEAEIVPKIQEDGAELNEAAIAYYMWQVFGSNDAAARVAASGEKDDQLTTLAQYLIRGEKAWSEGSVSDPCYLACKEVLDGYKPNDDENDEDSCTNGFTGAVVECLQNSHPECRDMPWISQNALECMGEGSVQDRALEEEETGEVPLVPGKDGVADLVRGSPTLQAALAQNDFPAGKVTINATLVGKSRQRKRAARRLWSPYRWYHLKLCPATPQSTGAPQVAHGCNSCSLKKCFWNVIPGKSIMGDGVAVCVSWTFCYPVDAGPELVIYLGIFYQTYDGHVMYSFVADCCVVGWHVLIPIPPPFDLTSCCGGQMHIYSGSFCPDNGRYKRGGGIYVRTDVSVDILFMFSGWAKKLIQAALKSYGFSGKFMFLGIEIGVQWGQAFHKWDQQLWWTCWRTDRRRRRRRFGKGRSPRRRRNEWSCHWQRREVCDTYTRWYVYVYCTSWCRMGFDQWEWTKARCQDGWLFGEWWKIKSWKIRGQKWKWQRFSAYLMYRKYNRR